MKGVVEKNMGLVYHIARGFRGKGAEYEDLIQQGSVALIRVARCYDPARGAFGPYAGRAIRNEMLAWVEKQRKQPRPMSMLPSPTETMEAWEERICSMADVPHEKRRLFIEMVRGLMAYLPPQEFMVFMACCGLWGEDPLAVNDVARAFGLAPERARSLYRKAKRTVGASVELSGLVKRFLEEESPADWDSP